MTSSPDVSGFSGPAITDATSLVDALDGVLASGIARTTPAQREALSGFARAFAGSPLSGTVSAAVSGLASGDPPGHHLLALAAARSALLGAVTDALLVQAGVKLAEAEPAPPTPPISPELRPRLEGFRQWLVELALAGFAQLDVATLTPALSTVATLQQAAPLARLAALATGFLSELLAHAPTSALPEIPRRRWADLWSRAILGTVALPEAPVTRDVAGALVVLGADVRHHDQLVSIVVHGVLEGRFVRTTLSSWRVDAITGPDVWNLIRPRSPELLAALANPSTLDITGRLATTGELAIITAGQLKPTDPFAMDLASVVFAPPAPRDRHPIQLAIPARHGSDPLDLSRSSALVDLSDELPGAAGVLGLRRWDDGWKLQPILVKTKKGKLVGAGVTLALAEKVKADTRAVLAERAKKLLRAS